MTWFMRLKEDANIYSPRQCPDYREIENFTIKLHHGGELIDNPKSYVGGSVDYIDYCSSDEISMLELNSMVKETGFTDSYAKMWYKLPNTTMDRGLFELDSDDEVMVMCALMPSERYVKISNDKEWTFISDRQKGLINALESVVPNAEHRFCVMHLFNNMVKEFKGAAQKDLPWKAARASTNWEFNLHMDKMKEVSSKCYEWLMQKPRGQWSRSAFRTTPCTDMFVNNHCEVFNSSLRKYRDLPILTMLREMHKAVMKRIQVRRDKMVNKELVICPSAQKKLNKALHYAATCVVTWSGGTSYSVTCSEGGHELVVDLEKKSCTCRKWELTGIPCYHASACIQLRNEPWENHVNDYYKKDKYMKLYSHTLEPIVGPEFWEDTPEPLPLPPMIKPQPGRPKKKRNKVNDIPKNATKLPRFGIKMFCKYCKASTHNTRTCDAKVQDEITNARAEGRAPKIVKSRVTCTICKGIGHNSRTCGKKQAQNGSNASNTAAQGDGRQSEEAGSKKAGKRVASEEAGSKKAGKRVASEEAQSFTWRGKEVTSLRQLQAAKRAKANEVEATKKTKKTD